MQTKTAFLLAALDAACAARDVILRHYQNSSDVTFKDDDSPVTEADIEAEEVIVSLLKSRFPEHGFFGEESGWQGRGSDYLWLIDPIDGTKSFVRRCPFFSTQIALMHEGDLILGVSSAPVTGEMYYAERGRGAWSNDEPLHVRKQATLDRTVLSTGNLSSLIRRADAWSALGELMLEVHRHRGYGDFLQYHLLAKGSIDVVVESDVNVLDVAALSVIVREAGGCFTDLSGDRISLETSTVLASGDVDLHDTVMQRLNWVRQNS